LRDLTVLRQIAAHLDGWAGLRARVVTDTDWPGVQVTGGPGPGGLLWRCPGQRWAAELLADGEAGAPVATLQTGIGEDASASEVADAIKDLYRLLGTAAGDPGPRPRS
jgi:hypothetical protein